MANNVPEWRRLTQYCEKHDQRYMQFLPACPICVGEMMAELPCVPLGPCRIRDELVPNKVYDHAGATDPTSSSENRKPEQLSLF